MNKELLYNFFQGKTSIQEEVQIRNWMEASPENYNLFLEERKLFDAMILLADEKKIHSYQKKNLFIGTHWLKEAMKIAAIIAITFMGTQVYNYYSQEEPSIMQKITVPAGQRINLELADGTVVWLNSRSIIQYPASFTGKQRTVKLDGEAYFEVAHNAQKPFIVETDKGSVEVLGTKFNLEAYSDNNSFITSLMEGSVKVTSGTNELLIKPDQMAILEHGKLKATPIEDYNVYRWKEGLICFKNETFKNIMAKFETCYGVTIKIENEKVLNSRYTGKFRQSDGISYALRVLQKDVKFTFERNEENQIIYIK
ncbi:FecR family protein [Bacteroides sp.]